MRLFLIFGVALRIPRPYWVRPTDRQLKIHLTFFFRGKRQLGSFSKIIVWNVLFKTLNTVKLRLPFTSRAY